MYRHRVYRAVVATLAAILVAVALLGNAGAAGEKFAVYGADLTPAERQELATLFGVDPAAQAAVVTVPEMVAALGNSGLPVSPDDKSVSSSGLTCLNKGEGLRVRTQNITRIPAAVYANALVTAGVGDGDVLVAAPAARPVTGETALVGVLRAFPQCQGNPQPDPSRVNLAYEQVAQTVALAGQGADPAAITRAAATMLKAAQPVITDQARDDAVIGAALDQSAAGEGLALDPARRAAAVAFLKKLGGADYGTYAQGYQIQQANPNEVRVVPAGAGAPAAGTAGAGAPAAGATFSGDVTKTGEPLTVRTTGGQDRQVGPAAGLVVIRDGTPATVADIKVTDRVNVTTDAGGRATRIEAASQAPAAAATQERGFRWWWLLPLLLLPLLLLPFLRRKRRDAFILERNAPATPARTTGRVVEPTTTVHTVGEPAETATGRVVARADDLEDSGSRRR